MNDNLGRFRKLLNSELGRCSADEYHSAGKIPVIVVLDNVRSRHNIGSLFRSSDAFSVSEIFLCGISSTPPSAEIHKTALGAENTVKWSYFNETTDAVKSLKDSGYSIISVEQTENSTMLGDFRADKYNKIAIVFGNEVKGVSQEIVNMSDEIVEIPQSGTKHSLNVSVAAGVVLWELYKQKKANPFIG